MDKKPEKKNKKKASNSLTNEMQNSTQNKTSGSSAMDCNNSTSSHKEKGSNSYNNCK